MLYLYTVHVVPYRTILCRNYECCFNSRENDGTTNLQNRDGHLDPDRHYPDPNGSGSRIRILGPGTRIRILEPDLGSGSWNRISDPDPGTRFSQNRFLWDPVLGSFRIRIRPPLLFCNFGPAQLLYGEIISL